MAQWPCGHTAGFKCAQCYRERGAQLAEAATFLDGLAGWLNHEADRAASGQTIYPTILENFAAECRAMAGRLRGIDAPSVPSEIRQQRDHD